VWNFLENFKRKRAFNSNMKEIKQKITGELKKVGINLDISLIEKPPKPEMGDYAVPCFSFARELKKKPNEIAKDIISKIDKTSFSDVKAIGPYVNFFLKNESVVDELKEIHKLADKYGTRKSNNKVVLIEGPSPNTNKPLHLGHVRNMSICKSLFNVMNTAGYVAKQINLNNNRGIHICKSMLAYQKWGENDSPEKSNMKSDHFIAKYYVMFAQKLKDNPELEKEAQEMLRKWEANDKEVITLWNKMNKWAFDGFKETYKTFNISFDKEYFESETYKKGKEIILNGLKKGIFEKDEEGAIIIDLTSEGLDKKVLLRSDGTTVYITQDINLAKNKYEEFKYDKSIYVVGNEQEYHFKVLFNVLKKLNFESTEGCYHLSYGMIELPSGKMKSREGTTVDADNLVEEVINLAKEEIKKRHNLSDKKLEERAKKIAMSAIIFHILKFDPKKNFVYNPKESLSFEGETGPYCQYVYARIQSITKKSDSKPKDKLDLLKEEQEKQIVKKLAEYPLIVGKISENYKISLIPRYLLDLCKEFNNYYSNHKIIQEDKNLESARLYLINAVAQVIANGLSLLGIEVLDEM
jgi:arginyl-tRNA synthetase